MAPVRGRPNANTGFAKAVIGKYFTKESLDEIYTFLGASPRHYWGCSYVFSSYRDLGASTSPGKVCTTAGDFVVEVYPDKAPKTVENFLQYVKDKHYDGTIFHRVIDNFMIQGGGFDVNYVQKPTRPPVPHEGQEALAK